MANLTTEITRIGQRSPLSLVSLTRVTDECADQRVLIESHLLLNRACLAYNRIQQALAILSRRGRLQSWY